MWKHGRSSSKNTVLDLVRELNLTGQECDVNFLKNYRFPSFVFCSHYNSVYMSQNVHQSGCQSSNCFKCFLSFVGKVLFALLCNCFCACCILCVKFIAQNNLKSFCFPNFCYYFWDCFAVLFKRAIECHMIIGYLYLQLKRILAFTYFC